MGASCDNIFVCLAYLLTPSATIGTTQGYYLAFHGEHSSNLFVDTRHSKADIHCQVLDNSEPAFNMRMAPLIYKWDLAFDNSFFFLFNLYFHDFETLSMTILLMF